MCVSSSNKIIIGFIRATHGLGGELIVESASGEYEHILKLESISLSSKNEKHEVESVKSGNACAYLKLRGIDAIDDAKKCVGSPILTDKRFAKPLKKNEWYVDDLKEVKILFQGKPVGQVMNVLEGGGGWLLEVKLDKADKIIYIPLNFHFVAEINVQKKTAKLLRDDVINV